MRGGKRPGAGRRPSTTSPRVMIPWRVSPRLIERVRWQALRQQMPPAQYLEFILRRYVPAV